MHLTATALLESEEASALCTDLCGRVQMLLSRDGRSGFGSRVGGCVLVSRQRGCFLSSLCSSRMPGKKLAQAWGIQCRIQSADLGLHSRKSCLGGRASSACGSSRSWSRARARPALPPCTALH